MLMITLYAKQKKRHRCTEQNFGLCGRRRGWDVLREQHWNMYIIKGETDHQARLDAWDMCLGLVHWEDPEGSGGEGGRRGDQDGGTHVNPWLILVNVWQNPLQYCKVISLQLIKKNKIKKKKLNIQKTKIMASGPITSWQIDGETVETVADFTFWAPKSLQVVTAAMKLKDAYSLEGKFWPT